MFSRTPQPSEDDDRNDDGQRPLDADDQPHEALSEEFRPGLDAPSEEILTREDVVLDPSGLPGHTEELVGIVASENSADEDVAPDSGSTPQQAQDPAFAGFQDTVSVSNEGFPSRAESLPRETGFESAVAPSAHYTPSEVQQHTQAESVPGTADPVSTPDPVDAPDSVSTADPVDAPDSAVEETQVLRRSLLVSPDAAETHEDETIPGDPNAYQQEDQHLGSPETWQDTTQRNGPHQPPMHPTSDVDAVLMAGATVLPTVPPKAGPRWLSLLATLILIPIAWYLLADASARLAFADGNPMVSGQINAAALGELIGGLVVVVIIAIVAAQSSLGLFVSGILVFLLGLPYLVVPGYVAEFITEFLEPLRTFNDFGANVVAHLVLTGFTGLLTIFGFLMVAIAWALYAVRRAGRHEEATRAEVAYTNPDGLKARWARKATNKK